MSLIVLTGASGSGKATIAEVIGERFAGIIDVFHFDRIGVPPVEAMIRDYGSPEGWQRAKTIAWWDELVRRQAAGRHVLFEGQIRFSFLAEAAAAAGGKPYQAILVDCDDATRTRRLSVDRRQPELANAGMMDWAAYLRREADALGADILDTSRLSLADSATAIAVRFPDMTLRR